MNKWTVKIELTPEQRWQIEERTGKQVKALELTPETLESRVTPKVSYN